MPFTNSNTLAQRQLDEGEKSRPTKGIDMTQNTVPGGHVHQFRAGEVGCTGCLEHRQDCDCWRCNRQITLVMPDTLTGDQCGEVTARITAAFDALVAERTLMPQTMAGEPGYLSPAKTRPAPQAMPRCP